MIIRKILCKHKLKNEFYYLIADYDDMKKYLVIELRDYKSNEYVFSTNRHNFIGKFNEWEPYNKKYLESDLKNELIENKLIALSF